jgi:hypothetical protein
VNDNGADLFKPKTPLCRRAALVRWTGWTEKDIAFLVASGRLKTWRRMPNSPRKYVVRSAQAILDSIGDG